MGGSISRLRCLPERPTPLPELALPVRADQAAVSVIGPHVPVWSAGGG